MSTDTQAALKSLERQVNEYRSRFESGFAVAGEPMCTISLAAATTIITALRSPAERGEGEETFGRRAGDVYRAWQEGHAAGMDEAATGTARLWQDSETRAWLYPDADPLASPPAPVEGTRERGTLRLYDRADGVRGHYCVGRWTGRHNEYWSGPAGRYTSAGTVYVGREAAESVLALLSAALPVQGEGERPGGWPALLDLPEIPDISLPCSRCGEAVCECEQKDRDALLAPPTDSSQISTTAPAPPRETYGAIMEDLRSAVIASGDDPDLSAVSAAFKEAKRRWNAHRELLCEVCGKDYPVWSASNPLWNSVMSDGDGDERFSFVCPGCFITRAVMLGVRGVFFVSIEDAPAPAPPPEEQEPCGCLRCRAARLGAVGVLSDLGMVVCSRCGNKRCPHASNHRMACTGSNEPGQVGVPEEREAIARDFERYVEIVRGVFDRAVQEAIPVLNGNIVDNPVEQLRASIAADVTRRLNGLESKILSALRGTPATPAPEEP